MANVLIGAARDDEEVALGRPGQLLDAHESGGAQFVDDGLGDSIRLAFISGGSPK
jgi:hypothetical protein